MKKQILILILIFLVTRSAFSGTDSVTVILHKPPPFRFNVSSLWNITLINKTKSNINVYLTGTASSHNSEIVTATTSGILLPPGSKSINASLFQTVDVAYNGNSGNFSDIVQRTGSFPAGSYEYCVTVKGVDNNEEIGSDCEDVTVQNFSQVKLISPVNNGEVHEQYPVFSWIQPTPVSSLQYLSYVLSIYEILSRQTPYDAAQSNPAFFQSPNVNTTVLRYPVVSRNFTNNRRYAVQVSAYIKVDTGNVLISQSDVKSFTYKDLTKSMIDTLFSKPEKQDKSELYRYYDLFPKSGGDLSENQNKVLDYGVTTNINFEAADKPGVYSGMLKSFARIDVVPKISLFGIPFGANIFYNTDNSSDRQDMNNFALDYDPNDLREIVNYIVGKKLSNMKDEIERKVNEKGEESREEIESQAEESVKNNLAYPLKLFSQLRNLGIGDNYPQYTDYTVSGVAVSGLNLEFNPGNFFIAFTGPINNRAVENTTFKRNLYSGRLGIGKYEDSHLYLTGMYAKDDYSSIYVDPDNTNLTPKSNQLFGVEGKLNLLKDKLILSGEIALSFITDDTQAADFVGGNIPEFVNDLFTPKISSRLDGYYNVGASYNIDKTQTLLEARMKMAGPGYLSLGSPGKANDLLEYAVSVDQALLSNQISCKVSFESGRDNLIAGFKTNTTYNSLLNINVNTNFENYPALSINYYPAFLSNDAVDPFEKIKTVSQNLTAAASYPFEILGELNTASVLFTWNNSDNFEGLNNSYNWNLSFTDAITFKNKLFLSGTFGLIKGMGYDTITAYTLNLSGGFTMMDAVQNTLGFNITSTPDKNQSLLFYVNTSAEFLKYFNIDARLEKNIYQDKQYSGNNSNDLIFRSTLSMNWE